MNTHRKQVHACAFHRKPLADGQSATVQMDVSAVVPQNTDRYGWEGTGMNLGNWYPILAVHDNNGWVTVSYSTGKDMTAWFDYNGVNPSDGMNTPVQSWARDGMQTNGVSWHHPT